jgi:hypothetical protein
MLDAEQQLETYHDVFYVATNEPTTDPLNFRAQPESRDIIVPPQLGEAGSPRLDGLGESTVGSPGRPGPVSAQSQEFIMPKGKALASETPLLPPDKKQLARELEEESGTPEKKETKKLVFRFGNKKKDETNVGGRPRRLERARATELSARR